MSIQDKSNSTELNLFLSQPAETAQPHVLHWLGSAVKCLSSQDIPLLEQLREKKFQNASDAQKKELNYYIKHLQPTEKEGAEASLRYPYWIYKLIKKAADSTQTDPVLSLIKSTEDQQTKENLVAFLIKTNPKAVIKNIQSFQIASEKKRAEFALLCANSNQSQYFLLNLNNFELKDERILQVFFNDLIQTEKDEIPIDCINALEEPAKTLLLKSYAAFNNRATYIAKNITRFGLRESARIELAEVFIKEEESAAIFVENINSFRISDEKTKIDLLKRAIVFKKAALEFTLFLKPGLSGRCYISDVSAQIQLLEQCAKWERNAQIIAENISALPLLKEACYDASRIRLALLCSKTKRGAAAVVMNMEQFAIPNQWVKQKIAFLCYRHGNSLDVVNHFSHFEFSDPAIRMRWALRLSKNEECLDDLAANIEAFFTSSQCQNNEYKKERYEIAKRCIQDKSSSQHLIRKLEKFYLTPEEQYFIVKSYIKKIKKWSIYEKHLFGFRMLDHLTDSQKIELIALYAYFHRDNIEKNHFHPASQHLLTPQVLEELPNFPKNWSGAIPLLFDMQQREWDQTQAKTILQTFIHSHFSGSFSLYLSSILEEIDQMSNKKSLEDNAHIRQQLLHWFSGTLFILFAEELSEEEAKWLVDQKLLSSLKGFRNPPLRLLLTHSVIRGVKQSSWREGFAHYETQLVPSERKDKNPYLEKYPYNRLFRVLLVSLKNSGIDEGILESFTRRIDQAYCKSKQRKSEHFFWETKRFGALIQMLRLLENSNLNPEEKGQILQKLEKTSTNNNDLMKNLYSLLAIMNFQELKRAVKDPSVSFQELAGTLFKEKVPIGQIDNFAEKYLNTFGSSRDPRALFTYASSLSELRDSGATQCLGDYATAVLNGTFFEERSSDKRSPTLAKIGSLFPGVKAEWLKNRLKFKLSDLVKTATTTKSPFSFHEFLKTQIVQDHHLDAETLSKLIYLSDFLNAPDLEERHRIKGDCEKAREQNKDDPFLLLQEQLFRLMLTSQESEQIAALKQLIPLLEKDPFTGNELLNDIQSSLKRMQEEEQNNPLSHYLVSETVDPYHLLLSGTDVSSCQRVNGSADLNKGLLDLLMNGANELLAITEISSNKIVARAILRLVWDGEKPVLFLERLYPRLDLKPEHEEALIKIAQLIAERLGIPLTRQEGTGALYEKKLHSLGGAPWCYSDGSGGVQKDAVYSISNARLVK